MNKPITPNQALRFGAETATWLHAAGCDGDAFQRLLEDRTRMGQVGEDVVALVRSKILTNPFSVVSPARDYPEGYMPLGWEEQLAVLKSSYPELSTDGVAEMAAMWPADHEIWSASSPHAKTGTVINHFDFLCVFPLPGKVAERYDLGDLWADVELGTEGTGLWGKLCEEILFSRLEPRIPVPLYNHRKNAMGSDRFLPEDGLATWLRELEASTPGDFAVRPASWGRRLAGYSVKAARWEIQNIISGIPGCAFIVGNAILADPKRSPRYGILNQDCPGDKYRFEDSHAFVLAPCFLRLDAEFHFASYVVADAGETCGSVVLAR